MKTKILNIKERYDVRFEKQLYETDNFFSKFGVRWKKSTISAISKFFVNHFSQRNCPVAHYLIQSCSQITMSLEKIYGVWKTPRVGQLPVLLKVL